MKVLIVAPHIDSRQQLTNLVERDGHEVVAVKTPERAIQTLLANNGFHRLIAEYRQGADQTTGLDLIRRMRKSPNPSLAGLRAILVSSRQDAPQVEMECRGLGAAFISRPLDFDQFHFALELGELPKNETGPA